MFIINTNIQKNILINKKSGIKIPLNSLDKSDTDRHQYYIT